MFRRFLCFLGAVFVLFSSTAPAFASGFGSTPISGVELGLDVVSLVDMALKVGVGSANFLRSFVDEDVCPLCTDMTGRHNFVAKRTQIDGQIGMYYVCSYCGKSAGEILDSRYEEYVDTLPGQTVNSDGSFLWVMTVDSLRSVKVRLVSNASSFNEFYMDGSVAYSAGLGGSQVDARAVPGKQIVIVTSRYDVELQDVYFRAPYDGHYELVSPGYRFVARNCALGSFYSLGDGSSYAYIAARVSMANPVLPWPVFRITPFAIIADFSVDTRVGGSGAGLYGYVQDGQLYQSTVGTIYNETTNVYQNPVTGETSSVESWTYDYSDRSYTLNTDKGDTVTVTYGDSNMTINEGGTTYNVYYLVEHEEIPEHNYVSSVTLEPTCAETGVRTYTCSDCGDTYTETIPATGHAYQSAVTMPSSCVNTGVRTFTCSECGDMYTQTIPAMGHTWEVVRTVPTTFDEDGQLLQEGYTLYQCSVCGEQYKITVDSGGSSLPLPSSGGTSTGNTDLVEVDSSVGRGFLVMIAHGLTEDLPAVLRAASSWFVEFPAFYSGFASFLKDGVAGCLPDVPRQMMGFGLGMTTFIGIIRKITGR